MPERQTKARVRWWAFFAGCLLAGLMVVPSTSRPCGRCSTPGVPGEFRCERSDGGATVSDTYRVFYRRSPWIPAALIVDVYRGPTIDSLSCDADGLTMTSMYGGAPYEVSWSELSGYVEKPLFVDSGIRSRRPAHAWYWGLVRPLLAAAFFGIWIRSFRQLSRSSNRSRAR